MADRCRVTYDCAYNNARYTSPCDRCAHSADTPHRERLEAENKRLRDAIETHRQDVAEATAAGWYDETQSDTTLYAVLDSLSDVSDEEIAASRAAESEMRALDQRETPSDGNSTEREADRG